MKPPALTVDQLRSLLRYDPETGVFTWLPRDESTFKSNHDFLVWTANFCGKKAGTLTSDGYIHIRVGNKIQKAHRLAWLYVTGKWPNGLIDHIDGVRHNNCFVNLRDATRQVNNQNQRRAHSSNKSTGLLGASLHARSGKYQATIRVDGKKRHIGLYDTPELAHQAHLAAKREHHAGCTI
jgi:HNH endonuclease